MSPLLHLYVLCVRTLICHHRPRSAQLHAVSSVCRSGHVDEQPVQPVSVDGIVCSRRIGIDHQQRIVVVRPRLVRPPDLLRLILHSVNVKMDAGRVHASLAVVFNLSSTRKAVKSGQSTEHGFRGELSTLELAVCWRS